MAQEQLFASFVLDRKQGLEIALRAESVAEATPITGTIRQLPASLDFVEGIMHLREEAIPIINLKKRLGLTQQRYSEDAMVAVVTLFRRRYGLLFDDIQEVFAASGADVQLLDSVLQTDDKIISALIQMKKGGRTVELLDLNNLFICNSDSLEKIDEALQEEHNDKKESKYVRYVVFNFSGQSFGVPVECTREITFFDATKHIYSDDIEMEHLPHSASLDDIFKHGDIDGTLTLRGQTIPVLKAQRILGNRSIEGDQYCSEKTRIMILDHDHCSVGVIVDEVTTIETIAEEVILPMRSCQNGVVSGIYQKAEGHNILLLDMAKLVGDRIDELQAMGRLACDAVADDSGRGSAVTGSHHVLTENCYLIFNVGRRMAVQLKDVQEIIEKKGIMAIPGGSGFSKDIINLRGVVVPVVNLREFYGYGKDSGNVLEQKLIICHLDSQIVALEVDGIVTIYKQEQSQKTTSVNPDLAKREDTLDRLIVFDGGTGKKEHVFVVNIHNLIQNHLNAVVA